MDRPEIGEIIVRAPEKIEVTAYSDGEPMFLSQAKTESVVVSWEQHLEGHYAEVQSIFFPHQHEELQEIVNRLREHIRHIVSQGLT